MMMDLCNQTQKCVRLIINLPISGCHMVVILMENGLLNLGLVKNTIMWPISKKMDIVSMKEGKKTDDIAWCEAFYYGNPAAEEDGEEEIIVAPDIVTGDYFQDWGCFDVENNWIPDPYWCAETNGG